jgi:hypothetical protein
LFSADSIWRRKVLTTYFFDCVVGRNVWSYACEFLGFDIGADYLSVAGKRLNKDKFYVANMISSAVLRGIWLVRNDFFPSTSLVVLEMEDHLQGNAYEDDDRLVVFLGVANPRAIEVTKCPGRTYLMSWC